MYQQTTADGMSELPVLFGRTQPVGHIHWGAATQLNNGSILGITGRRRGAANNYVPFVADHTLGASIETNFGFQYVTEALLNEVGNFDSDPNHGYCKTPPNGPNCSLTQYFNDANYFPDGRALLSHNTSRTYLGTDGEDGEIFYRSYGSNAVYLPKNFGLSLMDHNGVVTRFLENKPGEMYRYPVWVGKRQPPKIQKVITDENALSSDYHIADDKIYFTFSSNQQNKASIMFQYNKITAIRVSAKEMNGQACISDTVPRAHQTNGTRYDESDHTTNMGIADASGFLKYSVPVAMGGTEFGDIPLKSDNSVKFSIPKGKVILIQGIDAKGFAVTQRTRLFTIPPGHSVNASVKSAQYAGQCMSCHGSIDSSIPFKGLVNLGALSINGPMDFDTEATRNETISLTTPEVTTLALTYRSAIRPILDAKCISCHSGESPAGKLSLQGYYSNTGNYPVKLAGAPDPEYAAIVPENKRITSYNSSVPYSWLLKRDDNNGLWQIYNWEMANHTAVAALNLFDPGYQNLFRKNSYWYQYLNYQTVGNFGRGGEGNNASRAYLIEVLSGINTDPNKNYSGSFNHQGLLTDNELKTFMAVIDVGFPYMLRCEGDPNKPLLVPSGPYQGKYFGEPEPSKQHHMDP